MLTEKELMKLKKSELIEMAQEKGVSSSGTKQELTKSIIGHSLDPIGEANVEQLSAKEEDSDEVETEQKVDSQESPKSILLGNLNDEASEVEEEVKIRIFTELPSRRLVVGGLHHKQFLATLTVLFLLMCGYGFQVNYSDQFSLEGDDREMMNCMMTVYYNEGLGDTPSKGQWLELYDPTSQKNVDCAEMIGESPNWWQEENDAWLQGLVDTTISDGNHTGFIWTQAGIDTMAYLGGEYFSANMSIYGDPVAGDEFTGENLVIWNGFTLAMGGGNDTFESLLPGGNSPFSGFMPAGIVAHKPTGFIWTQVGIDTMNYLGTTTFNANMSIFNDPSEGDVFTDQHLAVWNGFTAIFPGGGNDSIENLLADGGSPFSIYMPYGIVEHAPTGYLWSHPGVPTMAYLGSTTFGTNMSVYGDPMPGDVFTEEHLAIWNGFTAILGGGNDTYQDLLPSGGSPFAIYMPAGILITGEEWVNQTPSVTNVSIGVDNSTTNSIYSCNYVFVDAQNGTDNSTIAWFVNGSYAGNSTNYTVINTGGISLMCIVTPYDALYWGIAVESESTTIIATDE